MAGCTTGAIYPHFPSKEELFATILGESLSTITFEVKRAMNASATPTKALRRGTLAIYKYYDTHPSDLALALAVFSGARIVRAHDVAPTVDAVKVASAVRVQRESAAEGEAQA